MPTEPADLDSESTDREDGVTLSLSGGGYRAMVFHIGALWRLNEVGLLGRLKRVSSVSGGSITAAYLGLVWSRLEFSNGKAANFQLFVDGVQKMADTSVDIGAVIGGIFLPGSISDRVAKAYDEVLFKGAKLANLPDDHGGAAPRFVINATNVQTAAAGPFHGPLVVSMRPFKPADAIRAVQITSRFPAVHGAPVHLGHPQSIGIADLARPDYGDAVPVADDEIPVFWACGVTPQSVIASVKPEFCITHAPGSMLITDLRNTKLAAL